MSHVILNMECLALIVRLQWYDKEFITLLSGKHLKRI